MSTLAVRAGHKVNVPTGPTRRRVLLGSGIGAAALLAGCDARGGTGGQASPGAAPTLRSGVTLQWMHPNDSAAHQDAREQQIAAFKQQHSGIEIERQPSPDFQTKLQAAFAGGTPPDLFFTRVTFLTGQVANKQAIALDDLIKRDRFPLADFFQTAYEQYRVQGKIHALPFDYPNRSFFMNVTAFQEAGVKPPPSTYKDNSWTWDAFRTAMEGLQRRFGTDGATYAVDTGREVRSWIAWVWNNGGDLFSRDNKEVVLNQPAGVEALAFLQDLIHRYRVAPLQAERGNVRQRFTQRTLLAYEGGQPDVGVNRRDIGQNFTWDVVPSPKGKGNRVCTGGGSAYALGPTRSQPEVWAFFKHIMSRPMQEIFMKQTGAMVGLKSLVESPDFLQGPPAHMSLFVEGASLLRGDPTAERWAQIETIVAEQMGRLWTRDAQPKEVADAIKQQADPFLK